MSYIGGTADAITIANDDLAVEDYDPLLATTLGAAAACLKPGAASYLWTATREPGPAGAAEAA